MRAFLTVSWALFAGPAWTASPDALMYTFDHQAVKSDAFKSTRSTSPQTARLLLAHRLGLSQYHSLGNAQDHVIEDLNSLRTSQRPLLSGSRVEPTRRQLLIVVEGLEHPEGRKPGQGLGIVLNYWQMCSSRRRIRQLSTSAHHHQCHQIQNSSQDF